MSSSVIVQLLFVIGPGACAGVEIVDRGRAILVGFDVDERGGASGQRLFERARELRGLAHGEALRPERARKSRPVVIGNAGELRRQRAVLPRAQPDIAERRIVDDHVDDRQSVARRGLHLDAVHLHAAVAGDDGDAAIRPRALHADGRRYRPAHGSEIGGGDVGPRRVGAPVMPGEGGYAPESTSTMPSRGNTLRSAAIAAAGWMGVVARLKFSTS